MRTGKVILSGTHFFCVLKIVLKIIRKFFIYNILNWYYKCFTLHHNQKR